MIVDVLIAQRQPLDALREHLYQRVLDQQGRTAVGETGRHAAEQVHLAIGLAPNLPYLIAAVVGVLLLLGLWTPLAGITIAIVEIWILLARAVNPLITIVLAILGVTVAMIGPGIWSVDARLYGRKHLEDPRRLVVDRARVLEQPLDTPECATMLY
jgi:hypothetical protein